MAELGAVGEAVRDELSLRAAERGNRIELARPGVPVLVQGDPNVIEVALRNLVENALQHSPARAAVEIRIAADGRIAVSDEGPGVAEALRDRIFEPFWSGAAQGGHAGLGLTIVRRIAERYGAAVSIAAAPGGGADFALRFAPAPARRGKPDPALARASVPASLALRRRHQALDA